MRILFTILIFMNVSSALWAQSDEIKMSHFMSPRHPMDSMVMRPMSEAYNEAMAGLSEIRIYPAGELGAGPNQQLRRTINGIADISFGIPNYTPPQFPTTLMFELPGLYSTPLSATEAMWESMDFVKTDFERVHMLGVWANNPTVLITRDRPVRNMSDLRGMKVRVATASTANIIRGWGGIPVTMPANEIYMAMSTGVIDATYIGPSAIGSFRLYEVSNFVTVNIPGAIATFYLVMNKDKWDSLSPDEQANLTALTGYEFSIGAAQAYAKVGVRGLTAAQENGMQVVTLNEFQLNEFQETFPYATQAAAGN